MEAIMDLTVLVEFAGTLVPAPPPDGGLLALCGPLLTQSTLTIKWPALAHVLETYFTPGDRPLTDLDFRKVFSGWRGVKLLLAGFRRLEKVESSQESRDLLDWLEAVKLAVVRRSLECEDPSCPGVLRRVLSNLVEPVSGTELGPFLPRPEPASLPRPPRFTLSQFTSFTRGTATFDSPEPSARMTMETVLTCKVRNTGCGLSAAKRRKVSGARLHAPPRTENEMFSASALSSFADFSDPADENAQGSDDSNRSSGSECSDLESDSDGDTTASSAPTSLSTRGSSHSRQASQHTSMAHVDISAVAAAASSCTTSAPALTPVVAPSFATYGATATKNSRAAAWKDDEPRHKPRDPQRPNVSYAALVGQAILSTPDKKMRLSEMYDWISKNYPYYQLGASGWQNSVRHNLSLQPAFHKTLNEVGGKGSFWAIMPEDEWRFVGGGFIKGIKGGKKRDGMGAWAKQKDRAVSTKTRGVAAVAPSILGKRHREESTERMPAVNYISDGEEDYE